MTRPNPVAPALNDATDLTAAMHSKARFPNGSATLPINTLIASAEVYTLFWGGFWQQLDGVYLHSRINRFFDDILPSELMDVLTEYSVGDLHIGRGSRIGSLTLTSPEPGGASRIVNGDDIEQLLQDLIASGTIPEPADAYNDNIIYFVYTPPDVVVQRGTDLSCRDFCGYHTFVDRSHNVNIANLFYAVVPYPCDACRGDKSVFEAITNASWHELAEVITDADVRHGWREGTLGDEVADICEAASGTFHGYNVQPIWSNIQGGCTLTGSPPRYSFWPPALCIGGGKPALAFVNFPSDSRPLAFTSGDGTRWAGQTVTDQTSDHALGLAVRENDPLFVLAFADSVVNMLYAATSRNRTVWTPTVPINGAQGAMPALTFGNGTFVTAFMGMDRGLRSATSPDGVTWSSIHLVGQRTKAAPAIIWTGARFLLAFVADDSTSRLLTCISNDGLNWFPTNYRTGQASPLGPALAVGIGRIVMAFVANDASSALYTCHSADGVTWTPAVRVNSERCRNSPALAWDAVRGQYLLIFPSASYNGRLMACTSRDGENWSAANPLA